jgi:butyrate kinase
MSEYKIFAVNPGSTSTKIALFNNDEAVFSRTVTHDAAKLREFKEISDQLPYREQTILDELTKDGVVLEGTTAFVGRGGGMFPVEGGVYTVNDILLDHAQRGANGVQHPAQLGPQLAVAFAEKFNAKAFVVNPPDTDELQTVARITGIKDVYRYVHTHTLNQKEIGIRYAKAHGKEYDKLNLIIAHIGGGVSVTAHCNGKMIDGNDIVGGDGPMAPTRCGSIPVTNTVGICFSGATEKEVREYCTKKGGLVDHLGTAEAREVVDRIQMGDSYARLIYDAMIYQIAKYIGSMHVVLRCKTEAIILTGGISNDAYLVEGLKNYIAGIAPIEVMAGEFEMEALAAGAIRVLKGEEQPKEYTGIPVWNPSMLEGQ